MTAAFPGPRQPAATVESIEALVELLVGHVAQAYVTADEPGALSAVREIFGKLDHDALAALVYEMGLETEPVRELEPDDRRAIGME